MKNENLVKVAKALEKMIAIIFMATIAISLVLCVYEAGSTLISGTFKLEIFTETILTLVVGIEFVRMLILHTPQSVIEVLLYAVARQIVISHEHALDNLIGVLAIAVIFVIQKYLMKNKDEKKVNGGMEHERQDD